MFFVKTIKTLFITALAILGFSILLLNCGHEAYSQPLETKQYSHIKIDLAGRNLLGNKVLHAGAKDEYIILSFLVSGADGPSLKVQARGPASGVPIPFSFYRVCSAPLQNPGGFQPDALFPLGQEPVQRQGVLEVWAIARIPAHIASGLHNYEILFVDRKTSFRQPVEIKVWNFSLPSDLPITILANLFVDKDWLARYGVNSQWQYDETIRAYLRNMREYKINALGKFYPFPVEELKPGKKVEDFPGFDRMLHYAVDDLHYRYFRLPRVPGAKEKGQGQDFASRAKTFYPLFMEYLRRNKWEQRAIIKIIDEPKPDTYPQVYQAYSVVKSVAPGIRTESAGREPDPQLAKVINIWVSYGKSYNPGRIAEAKRLGQEIWLYANRLHGIDRPLVQQRVIGWYLYQYDFSGYLLWGMDHWLSDPWGPVRPFDKYRFRRGTFYYPNPRGGMPVPTTRLESLRQGFQDYQYLRLFDEAYRGGKVSPAVFNDISQKVRFVTRDLNALNPPISMQQLEEIRYQIGEVLNRSNPSSTVNTDLFL
jgi:hypothetical protein